MDNFRLLRLRSYHFQRSHVEHPRLAKRINLIGPLPARKLHHMNHNEDVEVDTAKLGVHIPLIYAIHHNIPKVGVKSIYVALKGGSYAEDQYLVTVFMEQLKQID